MEIRVKRLLFVIIILASFSGCAAIHEMPLSRTNTNPVDFNKKSIVIGKISIHNKNKFDFQPSLLEVFVKTNGEDLSFVNPYPIIDFTNPEIIIDPKEVGNEYLFSFDVEPGVIELSSFIFGIKGFLVNGSGYLPFDQEIEISKNEIIYIGDIRVSIVPRKNGEPRAGLVIPLVDQAVTGFSNGTYKVDIHDSYESDISLLIKKFKQLKGREIKKMVLPPWEYPKEAINHN